MANTPIELYTPLVDDDGEVDLAKKRIEIYFSALDDGNTEKQKFLAIKKQIQDHVAAKLASLPEGTSSLKRGNTAGLIWAQFYLEYVKHNSAIPELSPIQSQTELETMLQRAREPKSDNASLEAIINNPKVTKEILSAVIKNYEEKSSLFSKLSIFGWQPFKNKIHSTAERLLAKKLADESISSRQNISPELSSRMTTLGTHISSVSDVAVVPSILITPQAEMAAQKVKSVKPVFNISILADTIHGAIEQDQEQKNFIKQVISRIKCAYEHSPDDEQLGKILEKAKEIQGKLSQGQVMSEGAMREWEKIYKNKEILQIAQDGIESSLARMGKDKSPPKPASHSSI